MEKKLIIIHKTWREFVLAFFHDNYNFLLCTITHIKRTQTCKNLRMILNMFFLMKVRASISIFFFINLLIIAH